MPLKFYCRAANRGRTGVALIAAPASHCFRSNRRSKQWPRPFASLARRVCARFSTPRPPGRFRRRCCRTSTSSPNEAEACVLLGREPRRISIEDAPHVAREIAPLGADAVVLKMGDRGCFYHARGEQIHMCAFPVEAVDSIGAGDTFNPGLSDRSGRGIARP